MLLNSTGKVSWLYEIGQLFFTIYTCENGKCMLPASADEQFVDFFSRKLDHIEVTQRNETSNFSLTPFNEKQYDFKCQLGNDILQEYSVKSIGPRNIIPNCTVTMPNSNESGVPSMTLSCEVNSGGLEVNLTLEEIGLNVLDDSPGSSQRNTAKTLYLDDFYNVHNASCKAYFPDIDITRSCTYPNIIKAQYVVEGSDIIVECDNDSDVDHWRFYSSDGREEDIGNRSWIREGGRSLLIRNISEPDVGKVVLCRIKGEDNLINKGIGFHVISMITEHNNKSNSKDPATTSNAHNPYLALALLFLTLWLITNAVCGVWLVCRSRRSHEVSSIPKTSDDEQTQTTPEYAMVILYIAHTNALACLYLFSVT